MLPDQLNWLNLLLVPVVGLLMQIRSDIAAMRATQDEHARRLNAIDGRNFCAKP